MRLLATLTTSAAVPAATTRPPASDIDTKTAERLDQTLIGGTEVQDHGSQEREQRLAALARNGRAGIDITPSTV